MSGILQGLIGSLKSAASSTTDAFFNLVTLLLNTTATNGAQNNTFLDSSTNNFTITRNGNTTQGTFTPFSQTGWSNYFNGSSSYLSAPTGSAFQFGTGDFTIEAYVYNQGTSASYPCIFENRTADASTTTGILLNQNPSGYLNMYYGGVNTTSATLLAVNAWTHVAIVRNGSVLTLYQNGVSVGTQTGISGNLTDGVARIGAMANGSGLWIGYVSNVRIVKGTAVYTSAFTPPTTALTAISGTQLLTCQSNRFIDNSTNAFAITVNGTPSVQAFSPFLPTAAYDTSVVGGSGYFDGTSDYLSVGSGTDFDFGTSDFSMEFWYWIPSIGGYATGLSCKRQGGIATGWLMSTGGFSCLSGGTWYDSWGQPYWVGSSASAGFNASSSTTKIGQWTHVMVTRQGTDARWFVNGQLLGYQSRSSAIDQLTGSLLSIGLGGINYENPFLGYISNGRISIGSVPTGYQTSSTTLNAQIFTPPTAPVTSTSQGATSSHVKYIGNFTNAGIYDSAAKNVLETVGNAQVSTTQAKWGTTAIYLDGTGDYLATGKAPILDGIGGDFTIEYWQYPVTGSNGQYVVLGSAVSSYAGNAISFVYVPSTNNFYAVFNTTAGPNYTGGSYLNTWTHVAWVRSGSGTNNCTLYLNGVSVATSTYTGTLNLNTTNSNTYIGKNGWDASYLFTGYLDDLRITNYARYTANFTPPTAAFPLQ